MKCEFAYCVYNQDLECILDKIQINALGACDECIVVSLDIAFLKETKQKQRKKIASLMAAQGEK